MTETLHTPSRPYGADSPLAYLLELAEHAAGPSEQEQRDDAETAAVHYICNEYGSTLGQAVDAEAWQGYPGVPEDGSQRFEASAVAWLDGGLWLHHTLRITEHDGATDVLTLIVPCTCGRGYVDIVLDGEEDLMQTLADFRPTAGQSPHDERDPLDCASITARPRLGAVDAWR
ncbi:hypothetical protein OHB41_49705 [Streptomyces sp. NBC_01571]|uniref:hypothetical protein n=1 Tax=Streptomyces sp. NBC_01571 TaxID=2975883 RepID=UPI00225882D8|nr:hypothetical protein [Streptomyces sp. NBC_01571]MCX4581039.1 hypothetical protein [Streptomyces sp. NBC_01571]